MSLKGLFNRLISKVIGDQEFDLGQSTPNNDSLKNGKPRKVLVNIGLDFGTAFTKVVVGEQRKKYAVPFLQDVDNPYLLPCRYFVGLGGLLSLIRNSDADREVSDLKLRILDNDYSELTRREVSAFLALVLNYVRSWLFSNHGKVYKGSEIDWHINIGLPTERYLDNELSYLYKDIVARAWTLSFMIRDMPVDDLHEAVNPDESAVISKEKISTFPEFVPQIAVYTKSPQKNLYLHSLVDIGAGTIDIAVFNVYNNESGDDLFPIFSGKVMHRGVVKWIQNRVNSSDYDGDWQFNPFVDPPNDTELARILGISLDNIKRIDRSVEGDVREGYVEQLKITKEEHYPLSPRWNDGVPLFLCGGGSRVSFYRRIFERLSRDKQPCGINILTLERPDDFNAPLLDEHDFDRLSVAYGLSYNALDLGEIMPPEPLEAAEETGGQQQICPNCDGTGGPHQAHPCPRCGGTGWIN